MIRSITVYCLFVALLTCSFLHANDNTIDPNTLDRWAAPYRHWTYWPDHVIPSQPNIPGHEEFHNTDVPCVYQLPGQPDKWYMSFIAFNGKGYNSFVAESADLVHWSNYRLAMGFGPEGRFDHGGCVIGAFLYDSWEVGAPRTLKQYNGKYWTLYGCYPQQGGYELRPGYEGVACSEDGLTWQRAKDSPILSIYDPDCAQWEKDCIYQPWLVEHNGRFFNFYNAADGSTEQSGLAFSTDLTNWMRFPANPVVAVTPGGFDAQFASDPKVYRDGDHWIMIYFGVGKGGAHIMAAFSRDLVHWTVHPEPLYRAGGHPGGLDQTYAHKSSLVYNPKDDTYYLYYCACGNKGRGIGLITGKRTESAATPWRQTITASFTFENDTLDALTDGILPSSSSDDTIPRWTSWPQRGRDQEITCSFDHPKKVASLAVYWFDDEPTGGVRIPASWSIQCLDQGQWQSKDAFIKTTPAPHKNGFNTIEFSKPIACEGIKIIMKPQENMALGILEWRLYH